MATHRGEGKGTRPAASIARRALVLALLPLLPACSTPERAVNEHFKALDIVALSENGAGVLAEKAKPFPEVRCPPNADLRTAYACILAHFQPDSLGYERFTWKLRQGPSMPPAQGAKAADTQSRLFFFAYMGPPPRRAPPLYVCFVVEKRTGAVSLLELPDLPGFIEAMKP